MCLYMYIYIYIYNYANMPNDPLLRSPIITIPHSTLCHLGEQILFHTSQSNYNICPN